MKRGLVFLSIVLFLLSITLFQATSNSSQDLTVTANILKTIASANVNSSIFFGNITKGFSTDDIRVDVTNTGTTNITIVPVLESSDSIFDNLYLRKRTTDSPLKIGSFSMNIARPTSLGGTRSDYFYMTLDLTGFTGSINSDMLNHQKKVIIWILPQD